MNGNLDPAAGKDQVYWSFTRETLVKIRDAAREINNPQIGYDIDTLKMANNVIRDSKVLSERILKLLPAL